MTIAALTSPGFLHALIAASAMAIACAMLSVVVVVRRWAFIGEGISHAGLGGAGTAWMIALLVPALDGQPWVIYLTVILFCFATAVGIGWLSGGERVSSDAAIGIFLVASLAWGFLAQAIYVNQRRVGPMGFENLVFGQMGTLSTRYVVAAVLACVAVAGTMAMLGKEILCFCFDPELAQVSGVRSRLIHYLLMLLLTITILIGMQIVGIVLVTALLILPATTAMLVTLDLRRVLAGSIAVALMGAGGGLVIHERWSFVPAGPGIVLVMFVIFVGVFVASQMRRVQNG